MRLYEKGKKPECTRRRHSQTRNVWYEGDRLGVVATLRQTVAKSLPLPLLWDNTTRIDQRHTCDYG